MLVVVPDTEERMRLMSFNTETSRNTDLSTTQAGFSWVLSEDADVFLHVIN